ncbi:uncharacterized protein MONBRDRAFT_30149 [Monosiga brevicollis MX1]|uniref:C-type lectin domain-containing protein n=1 Tax=Monosiga brevicollis TaxID=81824 RepID=A9VD57_MONBE|nr:uncharacterized protein MONBRDRAFT_30149 [Monosiga brevicollis MX1]EDQ84543.1 predicted protein [Monosiga brevicollis MX1]|eukprot:XP_001750659.1 hypothetical protein [Monosiga brevicollis MX1]
MAHPSVLPRAIGALVCLCIVFHASTTQAAPLVTGYDGWTFYQTSEYRYFGDTYKAYFADAKAACKAEGGDLASIITRDEYNVILDLVPNSINQVWVGGELTNGAITNWIDGSLFVDTTPTLWLTDEPSNGRHDGCLILDQGRGGLDNYRCDRTRTYVCKRPLEMSSSSTSTSTSNSYTGAVIIYSTGTSAYSVVYRTTLLGRTYGSDDTSSTYFGQTMSMGGLRLAVGAYLHNNLGRVYIFSRSSASSLSYADNVKVIEPPYTTTNTNFGWGVGLSPNGNALLVSAPNNGAGVVYRYEFANNAWTLKRTFTAESAGINQLFGYGILMVPDSEEDGDITAIGNSLADTFATNSGAVVTISKFKSAFSDDDDA